MKYRTFVYEAKNGLYSNEVIYTIVTAYKGGGESPTPRTSLINRRYYEKILMGNMCY